jgi:hypothetical protein
MEGDLSSFEETVLFIVIVLVSGWYLFTKDDWGKH